MYILNEIMETQYTVSGWQMLVVAAGLIALIVIDIIDYARLENNMEVLKFEYINRGWRNRIKWEDEQFRKSFAETGEVLIHEYEGNDGEIHFEVKFYEE